MAGHQHAFLPSLMHGILTPPPSLEKMISADFCDPHSSLLSHNVTLNVLLWYYVAPTPKTPKVTPKE
eukprot:5535765-Amphidinium_carterae.1